jgi:hypothetical protein
MGEVREEVREKAGEVREMRGVALHGMLSEVNARLQVRRES